MKLKQSIKKMNYKRKEIKRELEKLKLDNSIKLENSQLTKY